MTLEELVDTFDLLGEWDARYDFISDLGGQAPDLPPTARTETTQVHGCMSQVWIIGGPSPQNPELMSFQVDGDGPIVKGLAAMLALLYNGRTPHQVLELDADAIFDKLGLAEHLSPNRHVGMYAMVERIKSIAREYLPPSS